MKWWGVFVSLATAALGIAFPAYKSVEAVESAGTLDDSQWLVYWLISAFLTIVERFAYKVLFRIPLYSELKLVFIAFLVLPQFNGANALYETARPYIIELYNTINSSAHELSSDDPKAKKFAELRDRVSKARIGMTKTLDSLMKHTKASGYDSTEIESKLAEYEELNA